MKRIVELTVLSYTLSTAPSVCRAQSGLCDRSLRAGRAWPTDGNGTAPGAPPTTSVIDKCGSNADCAIPSAVCVAALSPKVCVGCAVDSDCKDPTAAQCNVTMHVCGCFKNCIDSDDDGIPNDVEIAIGTDPHDADSDDDGVADGAEPDAGLVTDGDGRVNALDPDSDNDGLFGGTELGLDCSAKDTDVRRGTAALTQTRAKP